MGSNPAGLTREAVVETASFFVPLAQIMHITVSFEAVLCISRAILSGYARMSLSSLKPSKDAFALILSPFYGANRFKNGSKTVQPSDLSAVNSSKTVQPAERLSRFGNASSSGSYPSSMNAANRGDTLPFLLRQSYNTNENACDSYEASIPIERILLLSAQNTSVCITLA